jgi:phosphohistidine phosphatase SixA
MTLRSHRRPRSSLARAVAAAVWLTATLAASPARAQGTDAAPPALVLVVRHAEKVDNSDDPALSPLGTARANALAEALSDARVAHVIVTHRQRTRLTAAPLMASLGIEPEVVPFGGDMAAHVRAVAAAVRRQAGKVVLVVGHSNTVPMIVHALGGPRAPDLCDARYAALFSVVPGRGDTPAGVVVSSFGVPDPPSATACSGMVPR